MTEQEVLELWRTGLSKHKVAEIYKRSYNQNVKLIRSDIRHRYDSRFITQYESLAIVERIIYNEVVMRSNEH